MREGHGWLNAFQSPTPNPQPLRRAFTLTELLVVIAIIAMLVAITSVAVLRGLDTAKQTRIKTELDQLDLAFKAYKEKYGAYPPCNLAIDDTTVSMAIRDARLAQVRSHVARAFPRYDQGVNAANLRADLQAYVDTNNVRPDQAIVFWLGGFNPNPVQPFLNLNNFTTTGLPKSQRTPAFMTFDASRLAVIPSASNPWVAPGPNTTQCASYIPNGSKQQVPYLYFDATNYAALPLTTPLAWDATIIGKAQAGFAGVYVNDVTNNQILDDPGDEWANLESFQVISAGLDDKYGSTTAENANIAVTRRLYPAGPPAIPTQPNPFGYDAAGADDDNLTNFCSNARLGDAKP